MDSCFRRNDKGGAGRTRERGENKGAWGGMRGGVSFPSEPAVNLLLVAECSANAYFEGQRLLPGSSGERFPGTLTILIGSCPCLRPWSFTHGAHLVYQVYGESFLQRPGRRRAMSDAEQAMRDKERLRQRARQRRAQLAARAAKAPPPHPAEAIASRFFEALALTPTTIVAGYAARGDEVNCLPLLGSVALWGGRCALPVVRPGTRRLTFRHWAPGEALRRGAFGIQEPPETAPEVEPAVVIVPLLAFDRAGFRLGYGQGYYDTTLQDLRARGGVQAIGLAYAGQEVAAVPHEAHDQPLDWILTEREAIRVES